MKLFERRYDPDAAKFSTQREVTYILLLIFTSVVINVIWFTNNNQSDRSTIIQTVINLAFLAAGFWLGASKLAQDNQIKPSPDSTAIQVSTPSNVTVTTEGDANAKS